MMQEQFPWLKKEYQHHVEKILSSVGGLLSLLGLLWVSNLSIGINHGVMLVASMGASSVLLFAMPHGALSQPWPLLGGHMLSAFIGVTCGLMTSDIFFGSALAVSLAIAGMYYLNCLHPPGGATALSAIIGGDAVHQLGYQYLLTPVLLNVLTILAIAIVFNYPFKWRRYPLNKAS